MSRADLLFLGLMGMIQTIIFDFGNVVGYFDHRLASKRLAACTDVAEDVLHAHLFDKVLEDEYESGRIGTEEFVRRAMAACGLRCSKEEFARAYADIFWPNPEVCDLVPKLKRRHRLLLLSNTNDLHARHFCQLFADTLTLFDGQVLSHEVGARKPGSAIYEHAHALAHCLRAECLFIDDLPANVAGAWTFGWQGLVYTPGSLRHDLGVLGVRL